MGKKEGFFRIGNIFAGKQQCASEKKAEKKVKKVKKKCGTVVSWIPGHLSLNLATMFPTIAALLQEYKVVSILCN